MFIGGCSVDVREREEGGGKTADVEVRLPFTDVSVRTEADAQQAGLPVYPGARQKRDGNDAGAANVHVSVPGVNIQVVAVNYESADAPDAVLAYYKQALATHGDVSECAGDIDFRGNDIRCRSGRGPAMQLAVGTEERHRLVSVTPRGNGSEFALVYVNRQ